jgi:hypothetical protein
MRYTFNMITMLKEKVNTHFSFPLRLDMSGYVERHLMPQHYQGMLHNFICTIFIQILYAPKFYIKKAIALFMGGLVVWSKPS